MGITRGQIVIALSVVLLYLAWRESFAKTISLSSISESNVKEPEPKKRLAIQRRAKRSNRERREDNNWKEGGRRARLFRLLIKDLFSALSSIEKT